MILIPTLMLSQNRFRTDGLTTLDYRTLPRMREIRTSMRHTLVLMTAFGCLLSSPVRGEVPWPSKTGPGGNGTLPSPADAFPLEWDEASGKNVAWKTPLEDVGHSTPVVGENRVWFTSANVDGTRQYIDCVDAVTGNILHHNLVFENENPEELGNPINNYAAPSCVLDSDAVYAHFGTYGTARIDPESAAIVWQRRDINVRHFRGPGSSPILYDDLLILTFDGIDKQFVTALNKHTGDTVWKTDRTTDFKDLDASGKPLRDGDMRKAFGTPCIANVAGHAQVISVGSMAAFGYDARTGKEIWTVTHDDMNAAAQPITLGDTVILNTGGRGANLIALRLDTSTQGNVESTHVVWNRERGNARMSFPVLVGPRVVFVSDTGVVTCIDAVSGDQVWAGRIGGNHIASPLVVGNRVYFFSIEGKAAVIDGRSDNLQIIARNQLDEGMRASPAASRDAIFLRTHKHLYKIALPLRSSSQ